jgi:tRNA A-37 threonylcarbamoyl transferase component Bud32
VGRGPGRREWDALEAARAAGLDVPEAVALARGSAERLVTAGVPGERLDKYLFSRYFEPRTGDPPYPGARPPELVAVFRRRRVPTEGTIAPKRLAAGLADVVARLAEARLYLPDLHPGNILISGGAGTWRLWLVDLAEAVRPAPADAVLRHLVQLEHFFEPIASVVERMRCHHRVIQLLGDGPDARQVALGTSAYRRRFYRRRDRRTRRESKYFKRLAAGDWRGWATADRAGALERLLETGPVVENISHYRAGDPTAAAGAKVVKEGRTAGVWRVAFDDAEGHATLFFKRHKRASGLGRSRSLKAFRKGHALLVRGIATARPAGAADKRRGPFLVDTLLATEPVDGEPLSDWLRAGRRLGEASRRDGGAGPPATERRWMARRLARLLRRMHDAGFSHRDLKAPNILVAPARGEAARPVLVDLDGLTYKGTVSEGRRAKDLMRLSVSLDEWGVARQTDRLRFLRAYLAPAGGFAPITTRSRRRGDTEPGERLRGWWRRIERLSIRKWATLKRKTQQG